MTPPNSSGLSKRARRYVVVAVTLLILGCLRVLFGTVDRPMAHLDLVAEGFDRPTVLVSIEGGGLLVAQQAGRIDLVRDGSATEWLELSDRVLARGEMGLIGIALHPQFSTNGRAFIAYNAGNRDTVLAEFRATVDRADPSSERELFRIPQLTDHHKGGGMAFGPDGLLYVGIGDDGWDYRQFRITPTDELRGAVLRIDVDSGDPYAIPDNPFVAEGGRPEIWDYGLRNPWRISFHGGDLFIADVGSLDWEEIDLHRAGVPGGLNFGWSVMEGAHCRAPDGCDASAFEPPIAEYPHTAGHCAVVGGHVYPTSSRGSTGDYLYADFCTGTIWATASDGTGEPRIILEADMRISSFGIHGETLLVASYLDGVVYRLTCGSCIGDG